MRRLMVPAPITATDLISRCGVSREHRDLGVCALGKKMWRSGGFRA